MWPTGGVSLTVFAYMAVVIGGWGSILGAVVGAMMIALFQVVVASFVSYTAAMILLYMAVLWIFIVRPRGPVRRTRAAPGIEAVPWTGPASSFRPWRFRRASTVLVVPCRGAGRARRLCPASASLYDLRFLTLVSIYAIMVLGFQFIFGHVGAVSLAQSTFFGLGGYVTGILGSRSGWTPRSCCPCRLLLRSLWHR